MFVGFVTTQSSNIPAMAQYGTFYVNPTNPGIPNSAANVPANTNTQTNNQVNNDKGANNLGLFIDDPYTCGGGFFGNARGGNGKLKLNVSLFREDNNQLAYSFVAPIVNEKWVLDFDYDKVASGKYKVVSTITDEKSYTASYIFNADVKKPKECTAVNNLTTVLIRTGGFVNNNSVATFSSFGILSLACGIIFKIRHPREYAHR